MVSWKVALIVGIIVALVMAIGVWFGYRYVSEHDDLSPEGWWERSNTKDSRVDELFVYLSSRVSVSPGQYHLFRTYAVCSYVAQTFQFVSEERVFLREFPFHRACYGYNCVSPAIVNIIQVSIF